MQKDKIIKIGLFLAFCFQLQFGNAQKISVQLDSIVKAFLIENKILLDPFHDTKYEKGKIILTTNYYVNQKELKVSDTSTLSLIVFGAYRSHPRDYLLIVYNTARTKESLFVGQRKFEDDIFMLNSFLDRRTIKLPLPIRREVFGTFSKLD